MVESSSRFSSVEYSSRFSSSGIVVDLVVVECSSRFSSGVV